MIDWRPFSYFIIDSTVPKSSDRVFITMQLVPGPFGTRVSFNMTIKAPRLKVLIYKVAMRQMYKGRLAALRRLLAEQPQRKFVSV